jgi:glyoxylase-like metal-dependent hydrolase (beta-lactamase superfamily II)
MSIEKINEYISYIPAMEVPISSDVGIIYGKNCTYVFDVGSIPESLDFLHSLNGNVKIVISHFHADHTWWLTRHKAGEEGMLPGDTLSLTYEPVKYEKLYIGKGTERYLPDGEMIREPYIIWDDIDDSRETKVNGSIACEQKETQGIEKQNKHEKHLKLEIIPMPSSHSKGSLALVVNDEYIFMGDSTYCRYIPKREGVEDHVEYNVQKLKEQIELLKSIKAEKCLISHEKRIMRPKKVVIRQLESIYARRQPGENVIRLTKNEA